YRERVPRGYAAFGLCRI
ncbi:hypothetical protein PC118_g25828, partial [Phytophthora cactorum]